MSPLCHVFADQVLRDGVMDALVESAILQALSLQHGVCRAADSMRLT